MENKEMGFIRLMYWIGVVSSVYMLCSGIHFMATYDFCPLFYGIECLPPITN